MTIASDSFACAKVLKAVADPTRVRILQLLFKGEKCVTDIAHAIGIQQPRVSRHLSLLRAAGLVREWREGGRVMNGLHPQVYNSLAQGTRLDFGCCAIEFRYLTNQERR